MEKVVWYAYLAQVSEGVQVVLLLFSMVGLVGLVFVSGLSFLEKDVVPRPKKKWWVLCFVMIFFSIIIPSKSTIYLMAVAEYGDKIEATEIASDAVKVMKAWLKNELKKAN